MLDLGMPLIGLAKVWFYTLCPDRPGGGCAGQHSLPDRLAQTSFQSGWAWFFKLIWSRNQNRFGTAYKTGQRQLRQLFVIVIR